MNSFRADNTDKNKELDKAELRLLVQHVFEYLQKHYPDKLARRVKFLKSKEGSDKGAMLALLPVAAFRVLPALIGRDVLPRADGSLAAAEGELAKLNGILADKSFFENVFARVRIPASPA